MYTFWWCSFLALCVPSSLKAVNQVTIMDEWKNLEFGFDSPEQKNYATAKGYYSPNGMKRLYDTDIYVLPNRTWVKFVSVPRLTKNIPFTLATVDDQHSTSYGPLLRAYPNTNWHLNRTCDGILAVFRFAVDNVCKRLWVIDSGRDFTAGAKTQICPPKILVFDLTTNKILYSYIIPAEQYILELSAFNSITLNSKQGCHNQFAYLTDPRGPGMVVFSSKMRTSWKTLSPLYKDDPNYYLSTIAGESFSFPDGLYTVTPNNMNNKLYFHPFASLDEMVVPLDIVHNKTLWTSKLEHVHTDAFFQSIGKRPTQATFEAFDSRGNLWFTLLDPLAIVCWNPVNPYSLKHFKKVIVDEVNLQFVSSLKIQKDPIRGEILIGTSNRSQKHSTGTVSPDEINYRSFYLRIQNINCTKV